MTQPAADVYESVRDTVERTARRFARRYAYDDRFVYNEEDILNDAAVIALTEAIPGHDPARGSLDCRVQTLVWNRLYDAYRTLQRCKSRARVHNGRDAVLSRFAGCRVAEGFNDDDYYDVLGRDARAVVRLLLSPVPGLDEEIRAVPSGVSKRRAVKVVLQRYLTDVRGWDRSRVRRAFAEIAEVTG